MLVDVTSLMFHDLPVCVGYTLAQHVEDSQTNHNAVVTLEKIAAVCRIKTNATADSNGAQYTLPQTGSSLNLIFITDTAAVISR